MSYDYDHSPPGYHSGPYIQEAQDWDAVAPSMDLQAAYMYSDIDFGSYAAGSPQLGSHFEWEFSDPFQTAYPLTQVNWDLSMPSEALSVPSGDLGTPSGNLGTPSGDRSTPSRDLSTPGEDLTTVGYAPMYRSLEAYLDKYHQQRMIQTVENESAENSTTTPSTENVMSLSRILRPGSSEGMQDHVSPLSASSQSAPRLASLFWPRRGPSGNERERRPTPEQVNSSSNRIGFPTAHIDHSDASHPPSREGEAALFEDGFSTQPTETDSVGGIFPTLRLWGVCTPADFEKPGTSTIRRAEPAVGYGPTVFLPVFEQDLEQTHMRWFHVVPLPMGTGCTGCTLSDKKTKRRPKAQKFPPDVRKCEVRLLKLSSDLMMSCSVCVERKVKCSLSGRHIMDFFPGVDLSTRDGVPGETDLDSASTSDFAVSNTRQDSPILVE